MHRGVQLCLKHHLFDTMVAALLFTRRKGLVLDQWLIVSDWLTVRVEVRVSFVRIVHNHRQPSCQKSGDINLPHPKNTTSLKEGSTHTVYGTKGPVMLSNG